MSQIDSGGGFFDGFSGSDIWNGIWERVFRYADYSIDDQFGLNPTPGYVVTRPEATPPAPSQSPSEPWFRVNAQTAGIGLAALAAVGLVVWMVRK